MEQKKKFPVWKSFLELIRKIKLPFSLLLTAFLLNLGKAAIELLVPEKMADLSEMDISLGSPILKAAVLLSITIFILALVNFIVGLISAYITYIAKARINKEFQIVASRKVFSLKTALIEAKDPKEFISRVTTDTSFISDFLIDLMVIEIPRLYFLISSIVKVTQMGNGFLALAFILVIPVIILGSFWSGAVAFKTQNRLQGVIASLTAKLAEKVGNMEVIKAYNQSEYEALRGDVTIDEMKKAQKKTTLAAALNQLIANILFVVPTIIILLMGGIQLLSGNISTAVFIAYFALGATYQKYIADHLTLWVLAKRAQGATLRLSEVMAMEEDVAGSKEADTAGAIHFDQVSFSYGDKEVVSNVSFTVPAGSKFAIVGRSGSGKSTLLNLIEQFYRPEKGTITLDGIPISEYEIQSYRNLFSYLPQNAPGFSGTIREMLCYGSSGDISDDKLWDLLAKVGMKETVEVLGGLDYQVGTNASYLSGGQRQRLSVCRMLLKDARIVLADEATSALDVTGAITVQRLIDTYAKGKTRIIVAHDLSTIKDADMILVMDQGQAVDLGTHEELKERCVPYQHLLRQDKEEES